MLGAVCCTWCTHSVFPAGDRRGYPFHFALQWKKTRGNIYTEKMKGKTKCFCVRIPGDFPCGFVPSTKNKKQNFSTFWQRPWSLPGLLYWRLVLAPYNLLSFVTWNFSTFHFISMVENSPSLSWTCKKASPPTLVFQPKRKSLLGFFGIFLSTKLLSETIVKRCLHSFDCAGWCTQEGSAGISQQMIEMWFVE